MLSSPPTPQPVIPPREQPVTHEMPSVPPKEQPVTPEMPSVPPIVPVKKPTLPKTLKKTAPSHKASTPPHTAPAVPIPSVAPRPTLPVIPPSPVTPLSQEWKGNNDTAITHAGQIIVQNDNQWTRFWAEHHPHEASPDVDFSRYMVVGIFLGQRPADGFSVEITGIRPLPDAVVVDYLERAPPPGTFQMAVEAYPYDIKVIPRSGLHIKFNKLTSEYRPSSP